MPEADEQKKKRRPNGKNNDKKKKQPQGDKRQSSPRKKTAPVPDQFLSKDFLEEAGFDDQDAHKLMKAIMDYNRKYVQDLHSSDEEDQSDGEELRDDASRRKASDGKSREKPRDGSAEEKSRKKEHARQEERSKGKSKQEQERSKEKPSVPDTSKEKSGVPVTSKEKSSIPETSKENGIQNNLRVEPLKEEPPKDEKDMLKDLVGKQVDGSGNVLDDDGKVIGQVKNDWTHLAGKVVNEDGAIVDDFGNIYGNVEPVGQEKKKGISISNGSEDLIVNVDATKSGISFSIHIPRPQ